MSLAMSAKVTHSEGISLIIVAKKEKKNDT